MKFKFSRCLLFLLALGIIDPTAHILPTAGPAQALHVPSLAVYGIPHEATASNSDNYFPMDLNRTWRYRWWNDTYEPNDLLENITVVSQTDQESMFYIVSTHYWSHWAKFKYRMDGDGVYFNGGQGLGGSQFPEHFSYAFHFLEAGSNTLLKYPIIVGEQWTSTGGWDGVTTTGTTTVIGYDLITVPAGTFYALHTQTQVTTDGHATRSGTKDMWFVNNVGMVKLVFAHDDGTITTVVMDPTLPHWSRSAHNPGLQPVESTWEGIWTLGPTVHYNSSADIYQMWYAGIGDGGFGGEPQSGIGYAESSDGQQWERPTSSPVLDVGESGTWDEEAVSLPSVISIDGEYKMWYVGVSDALTMAIGLATSADGISWIKSSANPVLVGGEVGSWDSGGVRDPTVIFHGGAYRMWYSNEGEILRIGTATSPDGITWTKLNEPVLEPGPSDSWDHQGLFGPTVFYNQEEGRYEMWYAAWEGTSHPTNRFGRAFSLDGIEWAKDARNPLMYPESDYLHPLLQYGSANHWEAYDIQEPCVLLKDGKRRIWFTGRDWNGVAQIGYAEERETFHIYLPHIQRSQ